MHVFRNGRWSSWVFFCFLSLLNSIAGETVKWETYRYEDAPGRVANEFIALEAKIKGGSSRLHVVKFQKGHPSAHIFLLPPAAGQSGSRYWEGELSSLMKVYGRDFVLYAVDLRGTANASPFHDDDDEQTWIKEGESSESDHDDDEDKGEPESKDNRLKLRDLTIDDQASDLLEIVHIMQQEAGFTGKLYLHARVFGCLIGARALEKSGNLFSGILFESFLPPANTFGGISRDHSFVEVCLADDYCQRQLGMDATQLRMALASISSRDLNKCVAVLHETLENEGKHYSMLDSKASDWHRINELLHWIIRPSESLASGDGEEKYPSVMFVLPLIQTLHACPDPKRFEQVILPDIVKIIRQSGRDRIQSQVGVNRFANAYLMLNDLFGVESPGGREHVCKGAVMMGLASPCVIYRYYIKYIKTFRKYFSNRDLSQVDHMKALDTKIIFVAGKLDLTSTASAIEDIYKGSSSAKGKSLHIFQTLAANPLRPGICAAEIGNELIRDGPSSVVESCLQSHPGNRPGVLDWEFKQLYSLNVKDWWAPVQANRAPTPVRENSQGTNSNYLMIAAILIGSAAIAAVLVHITWTVWMNRRAQHDTV